MSAFFVTCRNVIDEDRYDLIVKLHTRVPTRRGPAVQRYFRRYQWDNLVGSAGQVRALLALFQKERGLGLAFPPPIHLGYATPGGAWFPYREAAVDLAARLGIRVPLDGASPLAPLGGMFVARPAALRRLATAGSSAADYAGPRHQDLARIQERLVTAAAGEDGLHTRTVVTPEHAGISHVSLEYKLDQLASTIPGYPIEQIQFLHRMGFVGRGGIAAFSRMYLRLNHPATARAIDPVMRRVSGAARGLKTGMAGLVRRVRGGRA